MREQGLPEEELENPEGMELSLRKPYRKAFRGRNPLVVKSR
jgi:hypothetical protein